MDNEKLKELYFDLSHMLSDFQSNSGGKNKNLRIIETKNRNDLIQKTKRLIEENDELREIIITYPSYHFLDQDFFTDKYFARDMADFLREVNEKYRFTS